MACQEADQNTGKDIISTRALVSYNNNNNNNNNNDSCEDTGTEEVIAEHHAMEEEDNSNEEGVQLLDDYLTEFDDMPHEVLIKAQFLLIAMY